MARTRKNTGNFNVTQPGKHPRKPTRREIGTHFHEPRMNAAQWAALNESEPLSRHGIIRAS